MVSFRPDPAAPTAADKSSDVATLSLEERAVRISRYSNSFLSHTSPQTVLALSATLDIDFFSRHSESGGMGIPWWMLFGGSDD